MREIALDTETSGLELAKGHRIIEIGCVELIGRKKTGRVFHAYVNPECQIDKAAYNVHGISNEFLKSYKSFPHIVQDFLNFIQSSTLIIHNASFDLRFINHELAPLGLPLIPKEQVIDTLPLARKRFPGSPASLDALCKRFGICLKKREKHGALLDAELLAAVYVSMHKAVQSKFSFTSQSTTNHSINSISPSPNNNISAEVDVAKQQHHLLKLSKDEKKQHEMMVQRIKNAIWNMKDDNSI
jgi:DNA polymerase III subunit epsilon